MLHTLKYGLASLFRASTIIMTKKNVIKYEAIDIVWFTGNIYEA